MQEQSMRNAIINGDMRIAQRGTSFAAAGSNVYTLDRWNYIKTGTTCVHTVTQDSDAPNNQFQYSLKLDCTTADAAVAAGDLCIMRQRVEGYNFRKFVGQTATLSFWVKAGKTGTMCVSFSNNGPDRSYVSEVVINSANTWEKKSVTLTFDYSGGTWNYTNGLGLEVRFALICGSTFQTTADAWQTGNYSGTSSQTNFVDNTDATCDVWITGVQLELGDTATDFEFVDQHSQLLQCYRYYCNSFREGDYPAHGYKAMYYSGTAVSTASVYGEVIVFPVKMRGAPSMSWYRGQLGAGVYWAYYNSGWSSGTNHIVAELTNFGVTYYVSGTALTNKYSYLVSGNWEADAEL
jgi:hypothetical protein